jgi:hypothetical protein
MPQNLGVISVKASGSNGYFAFRRESEEETLIACLYDSRHVQKHNIGLQDEHYWRHPKSMQLSDKDWNAIATEFNMEVTKQLEAADGVAQPDQLLNFTCTNRLKEYDHRLAKLVARQKAALAATNQPNRQLTREQPDKLPCASKLESPVPQVKTSKPCRNLVNRETNCVTLVCAMKVAKVNRKNQYVLIFQWCYEV